MEELVAGYVSPAQGCFHNALEHPNAVGRDSDVNLGELFFQHLLHAPHESLVCPCIIALHIEADDLILVAHTLVNPLAQHDRGLECHTIKSVE